MRYIKIIISSILAMIIAAAVIWAGLFMVIFSAISAPILAWWLNRKRAESDIVVEAPNNTTDTDKEASYKVIEAEYEIIDK